MESLNPISRIPIDPRRVPPSRDEEKQRKHKEEESKPKQRQGDSVELHDQDQQVEQEHPQKPDLNERSGPLDLSA